MCPVLKQLAHSMQGHWAPFRETALSERLHFTLMWLYAEACILLKNYFKTPSFNCGSSYRSRWSVLSNFDLVLQILRNSNSKFQICYVHIWFVVIPVVPLTKIRSGAVSNQWEIHCKQMIRRCTRTAHNRQRSPAKVHSRAAHPVPRRQLRSMHCICGKCSTAAITTLRLQSVHCSCGAGMSPATDTVSTVLWRLLDYPPIWPGGRGRCDFSMQRC